MSFPRRRYRSRPRAYTEYQVAQHNILVLDIQKNNARISNALLRLVRISPRHPQFTSLCQEIATLVSVISLQISVCEDIARNNSHETYDKIELIVGLLCDFCLESGKRRDGQKHYQRSAVLEPSKAWAMQVERSDALTKSVTHNVLRSCSYKEPTLEASLRSLADLSKVICRQLRHIDQISWRGRPEINVVVDRSTVCPECSRPYAGNPSVE